MTKRCIKWLPVLFLLLYPLRHANVGMDLYDAGYALGNYRFFDQMNPIWRTATYLANVTGMLLMKLPYGDTWVGMNAYTALMLGLTAAVTYAFLVKRLGYPILIFAGELLALSLCWASTTILYHYMSYYAITAAALLLYEAITGRKGIYYILAGIILGLSVCVRMPNITYVALIVPVWYAAWRQRDRGWLRYSLQCMAGFFGGFLVPFGAIAFQYGLTAYTDMIQSLFGMTDTATDYKPTAMLTAMLGDYVQYSVWLLLFFLYCLAGILLFRIQAGKWETLKKLLYLAGIAVLIRFCYGRGMFGVDYQDYFSVYKWVTVFLLLVILLCVFTLFCSKAEERYRLWSIFLLVIIFVTPLGSNNALYPIMNNLFLTAPIAFCMFFDLIKKYQALSKFPVHATLAIICLATMFQSVIFGICYVPQDKLETGEQRVEAVITGSSATKGMYARTDKVEALDELGTFLTDHDLLDKRVILYGDIPSVSYIFDMEPAVFTTWADLASNTLENLEADLNDLEDDDPVIIVSAAVGAVLNGETATEDKKLEAIAEFVQKKGYVNSYTNGSFCVYTLPIM